MTFPRGKRKGNRLVVTRRFSGKKVTKVINPPKRKKDINQEHTYDEDTTTNPMPNCEEFENPSEMNYDIKRTRYEIFKEKEYSYWDEQNDFVGMYSKKYEEFLPSLCCLCEKTLADGCVWCKSCGPSTIYCEDCATKLHENIHFHSLVQVMVKLLYCTYDFIISNTLDTLIHHKCCFECSVLSMG